MPLISRPFSAAFAAVLLLSGSPSMAEDTASPDMVLATVNGTEITLAHAIAVRAGLPQQYDQFPAELLFQGILDQLVQQTLLMQSMDGEPSLQARVTVENETRAILAGEQIAAITAAPIDAEDLQAAYDAQYPSEANETEYRASHILVETEDEAQSLLADLAGGSDFAALAREHSTGPSGAVGGDLGWFGDGDMVPEFFAAVVALEPGNVSPPVKTDFGWHIVKLTETRQKERPELDTVKAELEDQLRQSALEEALAGLTQAAEIERTDLSGFDSQAINNYELLEN